MKQIEQEGKDDKKQKVLSSSRIQQSNMTYDHNGNILFVKNPKIKSNDFSKIDFKVGEYGDANQSAMKSHKEEEEGENEYSDDLPTYASKAQYSNIMQGLYSQPSKTIRLKPGVSLNERGKIIEGPQYQHPN